MEITELFKDSFNYAIKDWTKILILGAFLIGFMILLFLTMSTIVLRQWIITAILGLITIIFLLVVALIYNGYGLSIIKDTINSADADLPEFDLANNLVDGLKVLIISIVYGLVPFIIGVILALVFGVFSDFVSVNAFNSPSAAFMQTSSAIFTVNIITMVLTILSTLLAFIAMARLAETGRLSSMFEFEEIFNTISNIGWGNYIAWFIIFYIIIVLIAFVTAFINFIPILGTIIFLLVIPGFLNIFKSRAIGLIYNESK